MRVSKAKGADSKVSRIEDQVKAISARRDLKSKSENLSGKDEKSGLTFTSNVSYYWDTTSKFIQQINHRLNIADPEIITYYFRNGSLIKVVRYRMEHGAVSLIGEYYFEKIVAVLKRESGESIDPNNIVRTAYQLQERGDKIVQAN